VWRYLGRYARGQGHICGPLCSSWTHSEARGLGSAGFDRCLEYLYSGVRLWLSGVRVVRAAVCFSYVSAMKQRLIGNQRVTEQSALTHRSRAHRLRCSCR
jgi:hypothetical protein